MTDKKISKEVSEYMSALSKKRKRPYYTFKENPEIASKAGKKSKLKVSDVQSEI